MKVIWRLLWNTPEGVQVFWNKVYGSDRPIYIDKPTALLVSAVAGRKPGKALDFGMGQGRNSVFLALRGWDVTGFDPSDVAVRAAQANAAKAVERNWRSSRDYSRGSPKRSHCPGAVRGKYYRPRALAGSAGRFASEPRIGCEARGVLGMDPGRVHLCASR